MANPCDPRIYGADDNGMASRIASDCLSDTGGKPDVHGKPVDQAARSKGNVPQSADESASVTVGTPGSEADGRAKSKGN